MKKKTKSKNNFLNSSNKRARKRTSDIQIINNDWERDIVHSRKSYKNSQEYIFNNVPTNRYSPRKKRNVYISKRWHKILNFIGYLAIFVGCLYQCFSFLAIYFSYPTMVELNVANEVVLEFPAVTVCNSNPIRYKIWCQEDKFLCMRKPNETMEEYKIRQNDEYNHLEKRKRIQMGNTLDQFIILAEYEGKPVKDTFQQYYDYEFTNCYTFNAAWGTGSKYLKQAVVFNPVTGKSSELILCVNMDIKNYNNITGDVVGRTRMTIHGNDVIPNPTYDAASLEAGSFYSFGIQMVTTNLLESPYQTKCRNYEEERESRTGAQMSQKNCLLECFKTETGKICGCTYRRLSLMYDSKACDYKSQQDCLDREEDKVFNLCNTQCPMACKKIEYKYVATDSEPLREGSPLFEKMQINKIFATIDEINQNMACMNIHYGTTESMTMSHRAKYPFIELFSLLGGYSGLWLGFSLLNGHEILLIKLMKHLKKRKHQKQKIRKFQVARKF